MAKVTNINAKKRSFHEVGEDRFFAEILRHEPIKPLPFPW
jgi:hypothetical protein